MQKYSTYLNLTVEIVSERYALRPACRPPPGCCARRGLAMRPRRAACCWLAGRAALLQRRPVAARSAGQALEGSLRQQQLHHNSSCAAFTSMTAKQQWQQPQHHLAPLPCSAAPEGRRMLAAHHPCTARRQPAVPRPRRVQPADSYHSRQSRQRQRGSAHSRQLCRPASFAWCALRHRRQLAAAALRWNAQGVGTYARNRVYPEHGLTALFSSAEELREYEERPAVLHFTGPPLWPPLPTSTPTSPSLPSPGPTSAATPGRLLSMLRSMQPPGAAGDPRWIRWQRQLQQKCQCCWSGWQPKSGAALTPRPAGSNWCAYCRSRVDQKAERTYRVNLPCAV